MNKHRKGKYTIYQGDARNLYSSDKEKYSGFAKLIYLDPPYNSRRNRGARKYYNDTNILWSLFIEQIINDCYEMLSDDGFLAISINTTELFNLKNITDTFFSSENFVGLFPVKIRHKDRQLMINATYHDLYEYIIVYRKDKKQRFICKTKPTNLEKFCHKIKIIDNNPKIETLNSKRVEIFDKGQYEIIKTSGSENDLRRYIIAGKIKTGNWSGEWFESHLRKLGNDKLIKVYGLENEGLGYRWFETQSDKRKSGVYYQSSLVAGRPILPTNDLDFTDEVTNIYKEGGEGCDFKDSKKPEKLLSWLIDITTKKGDAVVDLFGGSGTTLAVCVKKDRKCVIVEKNEKPFEILQNRVRNLLQEKKFKIETLEL